MGDRAIHIVIHFESGPETGREVHLQPGETRKFGRGDKADVPIPYDSLLSALHFSIECSEAGAKVSDLGSRNGTKLNGTPIREAQLRHKDYITAGETGFTVFLLKEAPREVPAVAPPPKAIAPAPAIPSAPEKSLAANWDAKPAVIASPPPKKVAPEVGAKAPSEPVNLLDFLRGQKEPLYAILDAARDIKIIGLLRDRGYVPHVPNSQEQLPPQLKEGLQPIECQCLFDGMSALEYEVFAPYLVKLPPDSEFLEVLVKEGWGKSWGIFLTCEKPMPDIRKHFRQLLMVEMPDGNQNYFRFYDPRVLRTFLPACTGAETKQFFGSVSSLLVESEKADAALRCRCVGEKVITEPQPLLTQEPAVI